MEFAVISGEGRNVLPIQKRYAGTGKGNRYCTGYRYLVTGDCRYRYCLNLNQINRD